MKYTALVITISLLMSGTAWADNPTETNCYVLARGSDGQIHNILDGTKVLEPTRSSATFSIVVPPGYSEASIRCERSDLVPAENDWKVVRAGYPLFIAVKQTAQIEVLELDNGQIKFETVSGPMPTQDQFNQMQKRLDQLQISMDSADKASPPPK
jgi:hypothetical protein